MARAKSHFNSKVFRAAYNAGRRGSGQVAAASRSRSYSKNPKLWREGFAAGKRSGK